MPWYAWGATLNTVHSEDDFAVWLSSDRSKGAVVVADGVSTTSGGGASFLAAQGWVLACRQVLRGGAPSLLAATRRCFDQVASMAADSIVVDADVIELVKKRYYVECSSGGRPCTQPLTLEYLVEKRPVPGAGHVEREAPPATTVMAAALGEESMGLVLAGDGYILGASPLKDETWLLWGALPQLFEGSRLARFLELRRGAAGKPLFFELNPIPGMVYVVSSDGVDAAALAEALTGMLQETPVIAKRENPAMELLLQVRDKMGGFEDDATIVVVTYYE
jgi:hypothetical protein